MTRSQIPDRFIAAAFRHAIDSDINWCLYTATDFQDYVDQKAAELARESVGDGESSESDKDIAVAQAVEFAEYVERQAKGEMAKAAKRFLSLPYSQEIAARLTTWNTRAAGDDHG